MNEKLKIKFVLLATLMVWNSLLQINISQAETKIPPLHHASDFFMPVDMPLSDTLEFEIQTKQQVKVVCNTCHGIENIQTLDFKLLDKQQENFLRGGPYRQLSRFCYLCHQRKDNQADNIHVLLDAQGQIKKQQCLYCHSEVPNPKKNGIDPKLRLGTEKICFGCHLKTPHLNALEHQQKVPERMLKYLKQKQIKLRIELPLAEKNQITCVTCHDPHQRGVLKESDLASQLQVGDDLKQGISYQSHPWSEVYQRDKQLRLNQFNLQVGQHYLLQYQRISHEVLLRLPAKNGTLCLACHQFSDKKNHVE